MFPLSFYYVLHKPSFLLLNIVDFLFISFLFTKKILETPSLGSETKKQNLFISFLLSYELFALNLVIYKRLFYFRNNSFYVISKYDIYEKSNIYCIVFLFNRPLINLDDFLFISPKKCFEICVSFPFPLNPLRCL